MFRLEIIVNEKPVAPVKGTRVALEHGTEYAIRLSNTSSQRCDAIVRVDGKQIGIWRVNAQSHIDIQRPADDTKRRHLTFYKAGTAEAAMASISTNSSNGDIVVTFTPEVISVPDPPVLERAQYMSLDCEQPHGEDYNLFLESAPFSEGATGLGRACTQQFTTTSIIKKIDIENIRVLNVKLVCVEPLPIVPL